MLEADWRATHHDRYLSAAICAPGVRRADRQEWNAVLLTFAKAQGLVTSISSDGRSRPPAGRWHRSGIWPSLLLPSGRLIPRDLTAVDQARTFFTRFKRPGSLDEGDRRRLQPALSMAGVAKGEKSPANPPVRHSRDRGNPVATAPRSPSRAPFRPSHRAVRLSGMCDTPSRRSPRLPRSQAFQSWRFADLS